MLFDSDNLPLSSISHLCKTIEKLCRTEFPLVRLRAEVSTFMQAQSGHCYFSLKDQSAQIKCVLFRSVAQVKTELPKDGKTIEVVGTISIYEPRGDLQFNVLSWKTLGVADRYEQFIKLKNQLAKEGLFAPERKRQINRIPQHIAVITSLKSAALHDVISALQRRAPYLHILVVGSQVQGETASLALIKALNYVYTYTRVDTLLLVRGGGSDEDLYTFNDESLVRKLAQSPIPVITGIGHEIDFTLCDFVADLRAATPTAAAEECALPLSQLEEDWVYKANRVIETIRSYLDIQYERFDFIDRSLARKNVFSERQRLVMAQKINKLGKLFDKYIAKEVHRQMGLQKLKDRFMPKYLQALGIRLAGLETQLDSLDPFRKLKLRNAVLRAQDSELIHSVQQIRQNQLLIATLTDGEVVLKVEDVRPG